MRADGEGGCCGSGIAKSETFRWLDAARYAVAAVVTVLIVAVIVNATKVVLRPDSLLLWVVRGSVYSTPVPTKEAVTLGLNLRAENPSGRVRIYFINITAYLFNNKTVESTTKPNEDCIIMFNITDITVAQQVAVDSVTQLTGTNDPGIMNPFYFDMLHAERGVVRDAAMRVEGILVTEVRSGINRTRPGTTYYCWPLVIGGRPSDDKASSGRQDLRCMESADLQSIR